MGFEDSRKHLLCLSYHELQCLCKRYNLPANKSHTQLANSLASLLEESLATSPAPLRIIKEVSTCSQINHKRAPYTGRDDDISLMHAKHKKGPHTAVGEASKSGIDTSMGISPVPINYGRSDCHDNSSSEPGNAYNAQYQNGVGIVDKTTNREVACENHGSPGNIIGQISVPVIRKHPVIDNGVTTPSVHAKDVTDKNCEPSDVRSVNASPVQFFVMSDEGINLVVDLNSSPLDLTEKFKSEVSIPPEPGNFSSFFSSLVSKDDRSTVSPSANIVVDIQSKGTDSNALSTNSSLGSDVGDNSHSEPYPADTTTVNTVSSASILPGTSVELSGYQEGAPVVSSSCLTAEVLNNKVSDMMVCALDKEALPQESVDVLLRTERNPASLVDASGKPTGNKNMNSPGMAPMNSPLRKLQTVTKLPGTDVQSEASSADHCIVGNFDITNPTSSSAASDNAVNPLTLKCGAESAQSQSADKKSEYDPEELEESESKMPPAYGEPPRNIILSLRSASARKTKPTRRSPRLVPK
ncbi:hypothetical protein QOZ80_6AG0530010 [Eleusine coracana subsp. coracana]|nr:hypothetical protein QOZ80_6AG0530010 [Eleusine coracana subsp. coracana]